MGELQIMIEWHEDLVNRPEDVCLATYFSSIVPRVGEIMWIKKPSEVFEAEYAANKDSSKVWDVVVKTVTHTIERREDRQDLTDPGVIYIQVLPN